MVGPVVKVWASRAADPGSIPVVAVGICPGRVLPVSALPGAWPCWVTAGTGWPCESLL